MSDDLLNDRAERGYKNPLTNPYATSQQVVGDRYELLDLIGEGATSHVYRAQDRRLHRTVAVKLLRPELRDVPGLVTRFYREAHAVAQLSNPHIVDVYDYGEYKNTYFIAMQYIAGSNLKEYLKKEGRLASSRVVAIINQVLMALTAAHSQGIIHRDIKPHNILIQSSDEMVKLADFGVAFAPDNMHITAMGTPIGTVYYMAPEQAQGGPISPATDLYSVGIVLYEMLAGQLPFQGTNQMQITLQHLQTLPPTLSSLGVSLPPKLERVVMKALEKDPANRYQSADEMRLALTKAVIPPKQTPVVAAQATAVMAPVQPKPLANKRRRLPLAIDLLLLLLIAAGAWLIYNGFARPSTTTNPPVVVVNPVPTTNTTALAKTQALPTATGLQNTQAPPTATGLQTAQVVSAATPAPVLPVQSATEAAITSPANIPTVTPAPPVKAQPPTPVSNTAVAPPVNNTAATQPVNNVRSGVFGTINATELDKAYRRDDGTLFGRPEVALYGLGTGYDQAATSFTLTKTINNQVFLRITGLDDEREEHCNLKVVLNGQTIFNAADTFPQVPNGDIGEGGQSRYWGQMEISVPAGLLKAGSNSLVLQNTTPGPNIGIPYILLNTVELIAR